MKKFLQVLFIIILGLNLCIFLNINNGSEVVENKNVKIAVVNSDTGYVENDQSTIYYGQEFLNLDKFKDNQAFVKTTKNNAVNGFKEGKYTGYVIIPENFSNSIESINTVPQQIQIYYQVTTDSSIQAATLQKVDEFFVTLDNYITQGYVSTLLDNVNHTQNNLYKIENKINQNNSVIDSTLNYNFIQPIDLRKVETQQIDTSLLNNDLEELVDFEQDVKGQLNDDILTTNNDDYRDFVEQNNNLSSLYDELKDKKYYRISTTAPINVNGCEYKLQKKDSKKDELIQYYKLLSKDGKVYIYTTQKGITISPAHIDLEPNKLYDLDYITEYISKNHTAIKYQFGDRVYDVYFVGKPSVICISKEHIDYKTKYTIEIPNVAKIYDYNDNLTYIPQKGDQKIIITVTEGMSDKEVYNLLNDFKQKLLDDCEKDDDTSVSTPSIDDSSVDSITSSDGVTKADIERILPKNKIDEYSKKFTSVPEYLVSGDIDTSSPELLKSYEDVDENQILNLSDLKEIKNINDDFSQLTEDIVSELDFSKLSNVKKNINIHKQTFLDTLNDNFHAIDENNMANQNIVFDYERDLKSKIQQQVENVKSTVSTNTIENITILKSTQNDLGYVKDDKLVDNNVVQHISNATNLVAVDDVKENIDENDNMKYSTIFKFVFLGTLVCLILYVAYRFIVKGGIN